MLIENQFLQILSDLKTIKRPVTKCKCQPVLKKLLPTQAGNLNFKSVTLSGKCNARLGEQLTPAGICTDR